MDYSERHRLFQKALEDFKSQFKVELEPTGYENNYQENDGIGEEEYWVKGLIKSDINNFVIKVGGWFSHDTRDGDNIYCSFAITINDVEMGVGSFESLQSWYENGEWTDLTWESY
jgi:hypothetical protein